MSKLSTYENDQEYQGMLSRASVLRLSHEGARLTLTDCDESGLTSTVKEMEVHAERPVSGVGDVMDPVTSTRLISDAVDAFGTLSGLCNVSGISRAIPFVLTTVADYRQDFWSQPEGTGVHDPSRRASDTKEWWRNHRY